MITLYIATHNKTGLKYFGKTSRWHTEEDLQKNYHGSGTYWKNHLKKNGDDVTMKIFKKFQSLEEASTCSTEFSKKYNIVESDKWANLIIEDCLTGGNAPQNGLTYEEYYGKERSNEIKAKLSRIKSIEERNKISEALTGRPGNKKGKPISNETKQKMRDSALKRSDDRSHSEETKQKMSIAAKNRPPTMTGKKQKKVQCPHCKKEGGINGMKQWHFENCKEREKNVPSKHREQ